MKPNIIENIEQDQAGAVAGNPDPGRTRTASLTCLALFLLVTGIYFFSLYNGFVNYDDYSYVTENPDVRQGLTQQGVLWAFTSTYASNWHPLTWLSHMLDCTIFGLNPGGHHFTNLVLHAANAVILFVLLLEMTGAPGRSLFVAALFAAHPLHVESVAWIAERKDLLSTFFALLSIWSFIRYARDTGAGKTKYLASLAFFAAGLMSKPMVVTLPFVLLLLDYWPLGRMESFDMRNCRRLAGEKLPFFVLSAVSCCITLYAQQQAVWTLEEMPFPVRFGNALMSYFTYLGKMISPIDLAVFYPMPDSIEPAMTALAAAALAAITVLVVRLARDLPFLPVGWFWYAGTLVPVIGLVHAGSQAMADRYTYIPLTGIFIILAWGAEIAFDRLKISGTARAICAISVILIFAVQSFVQVSYWRDSFTLFRHALNVTKDNFVAHNNLGVHLARLKRLVEAEANFLAALRIAPDYVDSRYNLALLRHHQGRDEEAVAGYRKILQTRNYPDAKLGLAIALVSMNEMDEARGELESLIADEPRNPIALNTLGLILISENRREEALARFAEALKSDPGNAAYKKNMERVKLEIQSSSSP